MKQNRFKILHLCHGLYGDANGIDRFIKVFTENVDHDHFIVIPTGKNNNEMLKNVIEIESLELLPEVIQTLRIDFLIIHWSGAESFTENDDIIRVGERFVRMSGKRFTLDCSPNSFADVTGLFHPDEKRHKTIIITHATYKLPNHMNSINCDAICHVSYAAYEVNKNIENRHFVIYPGMEEKFLQRFELRPSDKVRIGWLGRLNKYDAKVYELLKNEYEGNENIKFIFGGEGSLEDCPPCNFEFLGNILPEEFFKEIDIFLYPTTIDSFSLALLEALSQGKICITSEVVAELATIGKAWIYKNHDELLNLLEVAIKSEYLRELEAKYDFGKISTMFHPKIMSTNFESIMSYLKAGI